jgi:hypothetical protein
MVIIMIMRMPMIGPALQINGDSQFHLCPIIEYKRDTDLCPVVKGLLDPKEHDMVAPTLQGMRAMGGDQEVLDLDHAHHALIILDMGVQFDPRRRVRPSGNQAAVSIAMVLDGHEGRTRLRHAMGRTRKGVSDPDAVRRECGQGKQGGNSGRKQLGFHFLVLV